MWHLCCALTLLIVASAHGQTTLPPCSGAAVNGILEIHCTYYLECINGKTIRHDCPAGQVLHRDTMKCVDPDPNDGCGSVVTLDLCANKLDEMVADVNDKCETYVRCFGGTNVGRLYCPATLVFNNDAQVCDFIGNVQPPCGTAPTPTPTVIVG